MTKLLEQVIAQPKALPDDEQDAIAAHLLAEIEDEQRWKVQFKSTTDDQWDRMAEMAPQEIASGNITPLAEVRSPSCRVRHDAPLIMCSNNRSNR